MPPSVQIDVRELGPWLEKFGLRTVTAAKRALAASAQAGVPLMVQRTAEAPPSDPGGKGTGGAFNTGRFSGAWDATAIPEGGLIFNRTPYGPVIEHGRRVGARQPPFKVPLDVIARWAQRRLGLSYEEAKRAAYPIARAISKRGLKPRNIMSGALPALRVIVARELKHALAGLR